MKTVYKYELATAEQQVLTLKGDVLCAGMQGNKIMVWAEHDDDAPERDVGISIVGTGNPMPPHTGKYLNTVFPHPFVFHIYAFDNQAVLG